MREDLKLKDKNEIPSQAEFGKMVAFLAKNGGKPAEITKGVGNSVNGRTRGEIKAALVAFLKAAK